MAALAPPNASEVLTVSALTQQVRVTLEAEFPAVWVGGEISSVTRAASGHAYIKLKDDSAVLSATLFRGVGLRLKFEPRVGMEVVARGKISVYAQRGDYQLNIEEMHPKGIGALDLAFQQLKERLQAKGYFDARRKKPLPTFPFSIALVTSPTGAAIRDMLESLAHRWSVASVLVVPVKVQGDGAAGEIAAAIRLLNRLHDAGTLQLDAVIVGRGGGSLEDLWAFNEEVVADAIFASRLPIVSAVGHEIDVTVSDLVADHRALTPSRAITDLTPDRSQILADLRDLHNRFRDRLVGRLEQARQRIDGHADRRALRNPLDRVRDLEKRLDELDARLTRTASTMSDRARQKIAELAGRLESLSPLNVLARGYSLTRTPDGRVLRDANEVQPGDVVVSRLSRGEIVSQVEQTRPEESP